jgi:hypothetical protein
VIPILDRDHPPRYCGPGHPVVSVVEQLLPGVLVRTRSQSGDEFIIEPAAKRDALERIRKFSGDTGFQARVTSVFFWLTCVRQVFDQSAQGVELPDQLAKHFGNRTKRLDRIASIFVVSVVTFVIRDIIRKQTNLTVGGVII